MSKAYSTKALPPGTVLREWRLEEVLGVGGFGIVYKGRGIYFDELVAIKEYFPSSISERDQDDTVVPVDSNAEEVHALGLKKFVEEAKLLWNLSTPTRHPHIVSVRSLFEIHGTAYMVMDFEDGTPLSRLLKQGTRFNQASLARIILPIAEGLDRAHRVGVLHRDIKPPNIMVGDDDKAVLIDFGSARFESGEATSTKVTFHTPPYAAIEQYVRTYEQGPWTDIYALGVVLYECVTGEKPPEVLERLHGGLGKPLAEGNWPGFSKSFLKAIDAAMTIRPDERPQSIAQWLAMFEGNDITVAEPMLDDDDDDRTRIAVFDKESKTIVPVAPIAEGFGAGSIATGVPESPDQAKFVKPAEPTPTPAPDPAVLAKARAAAPPADVANPETDDKAAPLAAAAVAGGAGAAALAANGAKAATADEPAAKHADKADGKEGGKPPAKPEARRDAAPAEPQKSEGLGKIFVAVGAVAAILGVAGYMMVSGQSEKSPMPGSPIAVASAPADVSEYPAMFAALLQAATNAGLDENTTKALAVEDGDVTSEADAVTRLKALGTAVRAAAEKRASGVAADLPWADVGNPRSAAKEGPARQTAANNLKSGLTDLREKGVILAEAQGIEATLQAVNDQLAAFSTFRTLAAAAYRAKGDKDTALAAAAPTPGTVQASSAASSAPAASQAAPEPSVAAAPADDGGVTAATRRNFAKAIGDARDIARQVTRLAEGRKPGSGASEEDQENYRIRQASAQSAKSYVSYLDTLEASMRGTTSEAEAKNSVVKASQTKAYLQALLNRSRAAS
ncbi:serine/threonine-protein kinase [Croceicoccus sp. BE223]|uniref:serine/threonine-protein kinase n=1 Tax=Croceicoccus sp. BE223 TaxID=2817716 RepID=UPI00285DB52C|nr:serine/threonine-protein kinase [Croceicoccus sp. BE223]MDR7101016.1 serine/threonine protein kinase [Croceicoccus sp. BE223]